MKPEVLQTITISHLLMILLFVLIAWIFLVRCRSGNPAFAVLDRYYYAHRGLHDEKLPENSLAAFQAALDAGYGAELDVHLTADEALVVMHDSNTQRLCGVSLEICSTSLSDLRALQLNGTHEQIPILSDVLELFEGKAPLIIELKTDHNNSRRLCEKTFELLDHYHGDFCIESFDPRVIAWLRRNRPSICRGQLAARFSAQELPSFLIRFVARNLLLNFLTVPDFISYDYQTRAKTPSIHICRHVWGVKEASWTVRTPEALKKISNLSNLVIFESFKP